MLQVLAIIFYVYLLISNSNGLIPCHLRLALLWSDVHSHSTYPTSLMAERKMIVYTDRVLATGMSVKHGRK